MNNYLDKYWISDKTYKVIKQFFSRHKRKSKIFKENIKGNKNIKKKTSNLKRIHTGAL